MDDSQQQEVINWVSRLILDLAHDPDYVTIKAGTDEKGLLIEIWAPRHELGRIIGKQGRTANALREIAHCYGVVRGAHVSIRINNAEEPTHARSATEVSTIE